jgi:GNAT superfamily N-acetyltransferase
MEPIRPFTEQDRATVTALGTTIIDWWNQHVALHLVAGDPVVAHLQIVDRGSTPTRRPGRTEMRLMVAPEHRRLGNGSRLYERALAFARERQAQSIRAAYMEHTPDEPAASFLHNRGFVELQRYWPSYLDVNTCDLSPFLDREPRLIAQGARFFTYADVPDTDENRRRLFELEEQARADIPVVETEPCEPDSYENWVLDLEKKDPTAIELAEMDGLWVGMTGSTSWMFTGVCRDYRGRGIAMALKARAIQSARKRGVERLETENHANNLPMLAINRKLGFQFGVPEVECIKRLD